MTATPDGAPPLFNLPRSGGGVLTTPGCPVEGAGQPGTTPAAPAHGGAGTAGTRGPSAPSPTATVPPCTAEGPRPRVIGIDLSLRSTGIAGSVGWALALKPNARLRGLDRMHAIRTDLADHVLAVDLVVLEGPAHSRAAQAGHHELAGLWWMVFELLADLERPVAVVAPSARAKYATGKGNASKDAVLAAVIRRYGHLVLIEGNDQADAFALAAMGADWLGDAPATVPAVQRDALDKVAWPTGVTDAP